MRVYPEYRKSASRVGTQKRKCDCMNCPICRHRANCRKYYYTNVRVELDGKVKTLRKKKNKTTSD